jgi:hypothetical protein
MSRPEWLAEYREVLPDFTEADVSGSCFAITGYRVHGDFGGNPAFERFRDRLARRGIKLMVDFVPNHTGLDHPWVQEQPDVYVQGTEADLEREPQNYVRLDGAGGARIFAHGRDPYFPGWPDTLQLDYGRTITRETMAATLETIAGLADGVRCDMAMLVLPDVFRRTWGREMEPFWPNAIDRIRARHPAFVFMAEVYWDLEWTLQQQGFDYAYDKRLYDRLRERSANGVRLHLLAGLDFQNKLARFVENHDEPRAAGVFPADEHRVAALLTFLAPGLRFFHEGQLEGRRVRVPVHLRRRPDEPVDERIAEFYARLLDLLRRPILRSGTWRLVEVRPAWEGNWTWNGFVAYAWTAEDGGERLLVVANVQPHLAQCYLPLPDPDLAGRQVRLADVLGSATYERLGDGLQAPGLYLDLPAWGCHVFEITVS